MSSRGSLQPDNRSALQTAIEQVFDSALRDIETTIPIDGFFNGEKMPASCLPAHAIERGVIDWSPTDSEAAKRKTVSNALPMLSLSCTYSGIKEAVEALGFSCTIKNPRPFVFEVEAGLEDGSLTPELSKRVMRRISAYKATRDGPAVKLVREGIVSSSLGVYAETGVISDCIPFKAQPSDGVIYPSMAIQAETYVISDSEAYRG